MTSTYSTDDVDHVAMLVDDIGRLARRLVDVDADLRRRIAAARPPRLANGFGGVGGGGPSALVEDESGAKVAVTLTSVEAAAASREDERSELRAARRLVERRLRDARAALVDAWNSYEKLTRGPERLGAHLVKDEQPKPAPGLRDVWCTSCERIGELEPRGNPKDVGADSTLCRFCHGYEREHGELPHELLLRRRKEKNGRLHANDFAEVAAKVAEIRRAGSKKKRRR